MKLITRPIFLNFFLTCTAILVIYGYAYSQQGMTAKQTVDVGIARVDITPAAPIRLTGYGSRTKIESEGIIDRLQANALAFGKDQEHPSLLITVDLLGISARLTSRLVKSLSEKSGLDPAQIVICASHTHGGPEIGNALNILQYRPGKFSDSLLALDQLLHIAGYTEQLSRKLEEVALSALKDRKPAFISWGQGQASFAHNRRTEGGPTDPALPILKIANTDGTLRAVLVNYACHGTTLEGNINKIHGDWISEARHQIEANHPGAMALIAIGCAGDADPKPRGIPENVKQNAKEIADNVDKVLASQLEPLNAPPVGKMVRIKLPFAHIPTVAELMETAKQQGEGEAYYARLALERIQRGDSIASTLDYPVQTWNFADKMVMVNLAGEVVVDYSIRLKNEFGAERLWVNAYSNDVPCYIASKRVIREGGYEGASSMPYYNQPSPLAETVEDMIVDAVQSIMPESFNDKRDAVNRQELIIKDGEGILHLTASRAKAVGPNIKYMPEWKAFGWFNTDDQAEWTVQVEKPAKYAVYLKWSVADSEAGKSFQLKAGKQSLKGKIGRSGSWFTYRKERIGTLNLTAGVHDFVFSSASGKEKGAMLDFAELILMPVK